MHYCSDALNLNFGQACLEIYNRIAVRKLLHTFRREYWAISPKGPVRYSSQTMA